MRRRRLAALLQAAGHDVVLAIDEGLTSVSDPRVPISVIGDDRVVLTQDHEDFADLHDLVKACDGRHPGILVVRFDNDPRHHLTDRGIVTALRNLERLGTWINDEIRVLNHWR
ncbi:MAG: DUF5615 family PIN-like protein [Isosphaeraceae bacterium]